MSLLNGSGMASLMFDVDIVLAVCKQKMLLSTAIASHGSVLFMITYKMVSFSIRSVEDIYEILGLLQYLANISQYCVVSKIETPPQ